MTNMTVNLDFRYLNVGRLKIIKSPKLSKMEILTCKKNAKES